MVSSEKYPINIEDLPGEVQHIVNLIGLKTTFKLINEYGGESIYLPKLETISRLVRDNMIRKEYTGSNLKELSAKFKLTTRHLRTIVDKKSSDK